MKKFLSCVVCGVTAGITTTMFAVLGYYFVLWEAPDTHVCLEFLRLSAVLGVFTGALIFVLEKE